MDARGPKYTINGIGFSSKKAVQDHCRGIIKRTTGGQDPEWGARLAVSDDDELFLLDFIRYLPSYDDCGTNVIHVMVGYVGPEVGKPHWGFYGICGDATEWRLGFHKFGLTPSQAHTSRVRDAKRNAILDQTFGYKEQYFDGHEEARCEATGEQMLRYGNHLNSCHVDHESPTFKELDERFFQGWEPDVVHDGDKWQICEQWDNVKASWQEFHRKHAKLRCVTKAFNLSRKDAAHESP